MTTITLPRAAAQQALEALEHAARCVQTNYLPDQCGHDWDDQIAFLRAALAQQAEPVEPVGTKALTHEAIADALSKGAPLAGDQRAVLLGLVADDKVWQRECDRLQAELAALRAALAQQAEPVEPVAVPLIDYEALIAAAYAANKKWAQGTSGCVAFKHGAEWFRSQTLAALAQQAEPVGTAGLFTLAHLWAQQAYFKGLGRPCDIDNARGAFEQALKAYTAPPQRKPLTDEEIEACRQQGYEHAGLSASFDFGKAARAVERALGIKE